MRTTTTTSTTATISTISTADPDDLARADAAMRRLHAESWGIGTPVVLVHGSLAIGTDEWSAQRPLADEGFRLVVFDRQGYGLNAGPTGEDFLVDADDIADLMGDGAHLVGHSYGGLGAMLAAARRPERTLSLTVLEAPMTSADPHPAWRELLDTVSELWTQQLSDEEWAVRFLETVGSDPGELPADLLDEAVALVPVFRGGRPFFEADLPLAELAAAPFPKLVVSGGHHPGFDAMCADLAQRIGATLTCIEGAGHEIQFTGGPVNEAMLALWRSAVAR